MYQVDIVEAKEKLLELIEAAFGISALKRKFTRSPDIQTGLLL
jgi:hypothetical protein